MTYTYTTAAHRRDSGLTCTASGGGGGSRPL